MGSVGLVPGEQEGPGSGPGFEVLSSVTTSTERQWCIVCTASDQSLQCLPTAASGDLGQFLQQQHH